jgi:4-hydroxybenzoate polyprenyltransferase
MHHYLRLIRINNWLKNVFIIFPLIFSLNIYNHNAIIKTSIAFLCFSLVSSIVYIINDIIDIKEDSNHPRKKLRPLPSGQISINKAIFVSIGLLLISCFLLLFLPIEFVNIIILYIGLNVLYSIWLKKINLIESFVIAVNFVLRVIAGCIAINVIPSKWIIVITLFLALFLVFIKRKSELKINENEAKSVRKVLKFYSIDILNKYIYISATMTIMAYLMYTIDEKVISSFHSDKLIYSTLFVILGLFRFIQLSEIDKYDNEGDPTIILIKDVFLQITVLCWLIYVVSIIYF